MKILRKKWNITISSASIAQKKLTFLQLLHRIWGEFFRSDFSRK